MIDLHVHTALCGHAEGTADDYVAAAARCGVQTLAFTDHLPLLDTDETDYAMARDELPTYVEAVTAARSRTDVEVLLGIEADWLPGRESETAELLGAFEFDIVLGSVHFLDGWAFDDHRLIHRYEEWSIDDLWARYFSDLGEAATSGLFDVMAHPDLVKKFGMMPDERPLELYEEAAVRIGRAGVAVEISTGGLRKPIGEIYPTRDFLVRCFEAGVPVTIGSDAHHPSEVAYEYESAADFARGAGYESAVVFRGREMEEVPL